MKYLSKSYIDLMQLGATYSNIWRRIWFLDQRVPTFRRACNKEQETSSKKHWVERNRQQAYLNTRIHQWRSYSKNSFWNFSGIPESSVSIDLVKMLIIFLNRYRNLIKFIFTEKRILRSYDFWLSRHKKKWR